MMLSVPGSRARKSRISPRSTSEPIPVEITVEKPTRRVCAQSRMAAHSAPDCETSARRPGKVGRGPQDALSRWSLRISPRLFGPRKRSPWRRARSRSAASSARPSAPPSRKPAETMIAPWMPRAPQSSTMAGTVGAGVTITARSTGSGRSRTLR